jgi:hypothetical protein
MGGGQRHGVLAISSKLCNALARWRKECLVLGASKLMQNASDQHSATCPNMFVCMFVGDLSCSQHCGPQVLIPLPTHATV